MRRNLTFKIYDPTNSLTLLGYSVLRILIVLEKEKDKEKEK